MTEMLHYALVGLGYLGSIAVVIVTLTWGLRGRLDGLSTEIKLGQITTKASVDAVMSETKLQTVMIKNVADNVSRLESDHKEHEKKDDVRFSALAEVHTKQAVQEKQIQLLEQRRPGYTPPPFKSPIGGQRT
jgi:hypothetical protein